MFASASASRLHHDRSAQYVAHLRAWALSRYPWLSCLFACLLLSYRLPVARSPSKLTASQVQSLSDGIFRTMLWLIETHEHDLNIS
jgi:hypothetical protein